MSRGRNESKYRHNGEQCPHCKTTYGQFKTGMTYSEAFQQLWSLDDSPETWRYKRRRTVLGYWHGLKKKAWADHIAMCAEEFQFGFIDETLEETPQLQAAIPF